MTRSIQEFYLVARGTVDEACIAKRDNKGITQEQIIAYAKAKNRAAQQS